MNDGCYGTPPAVRRKIGTGAAVLAPPALQPGMSYDPGTFTSPNYGQTFVGSDVPLVRGVRGDSAGYALSYTGAAGLMIPQRPACRPGDTLVVFFACGTSGVPTPIRPPSTRDPWVLLASSSGYPQLSVYTHLVGPWPDGPYWAGQPGQPVYDAWTGPANQLTMGNIINIGPTVPGQPFQPGYGFTAGSAQTLWPMSPIPSRPVPSFALCFFHGTNATYIYGGGGPDAPWPLAGWQMLWPYAPATTLWASVQGGRVPPVGQVNFQDGSYTASFTGIVNPAPTATPAYTAVPTGL